MPARLQELAAYLVLCADSVEDGGAPQEMDMLVVKARELAEQVQAALQPMAEIPRYRPSLMALGRMLEDDSEKGEWVQAADAERAILQATEAAKSR